MSDEELARLARLGDRQSQLCLLNRHRALVRIKARGYFLVGADQEDIVQEGMLGLYKAIRDYQPERGVPFRNFADLCIRRQMISAVKNATRMKHAPLNSSVSLDTPFLGEDGGRSLLDLISEGSGDPEELLIRKEQQTDFWTGLSGIFSPFEQQVLNCFLEGRSYQEIARATGRHVKGVDNALQRIRRKIARRLAEEA